MLPETSRQAERLKQNALLVGAVLRNDTGEATKLARDITVDENGLFYKSVALVMAANYQRAEEFFRGFLRLQTEITTAARVPSRSPLHVQLAHFYLGQVYEKTGKRDEAIAEYKQFLSAYEGSKTRLPQVAEGRAALKRLGA